ncbi:MAG: hypothetical protein ACR2QE_20025 [Acidimicrobiales bacterium]
MFDQVADAVSSLISPDYEDFQHKAHRYGVKVWFGPKKPTRAHYESQFINRRLVDGTEGWAIETGFHTEHPKPDDNDAVVAALTAGEKKWRKRLGPEAELGPFYGRPDDWYRLSEAWIEPDDPDLVFELASRLTDYIETLEPILRAKT